MSVPRSSPLFQFYLSSIKSKSSGKYTAYNDVFQFYLSSIKSGFSHVV